MEVVNIDNVAIVPQDDPLSTDIIYNGFSTEQKSYKISDSELVQELVIIEDSTLNKNIRENQQSSANVEKKLYDILPINTEKKSFNNVCSNITSQKISVMQDLIKKEFNERASNENASNYVSAIEQPNIGMCSCFVCGNILPDPNERFMYLDYQRLLGVKLTVLQFLSEILCQKVITNSPEIYLCQKCSDLINEADTISKQLSKIKQEIEKYFNENERPKLTYKIIPHYSNVMIEAKKEINANAERAEISLRELALTRPRHRSKIKHFDSTSKRSGIVKKTLGRPRKPFQCSVCKLKFISNLLLNRHCIKEHLTEKDTFLRRNDISNVNVNTISSTNCSKILNTNDIEENFHQNKQLQPKLTTIPEIPLLHRLPQQRSTSLPPMPVRPIQPKPQTLYQLNNDGSVVFLMDPVTNETSAALVTVTPSYINLNKQLFYSCDVCRKKFVDEKSFKMHRIAAHGIRRNKTDSTNCKKPKDILDSVFDCPLCESIFRSKILLYQHINIVHFNEYITLKERKGKLYKCELCEKFFTFKYEMESHKEIHLPLNKSGLHEFVCNVCGLKLASKTAFKIHLHRFHKDEGLEVKDYLCAQCGYMTHTKRAFTDHSRNHNNNVSSIKMQCQLCKKEILSSSLKIHMARVHGEAKFSCKICDKKFNVRSDLMRHDNSIHLNLQPYDCPDCESKYVTSEALRYHRKKCHICDTCGNDYKLKAELLCHVNQCCKVIRSSNDCQLYPTNNLDQQKFKLHMSVKHNHSKDLRYQKDKNKISEYECVNKNKSITLSRKDSYESQGLISNPAMSAAPSHTEHCVDTLPSAALCNIYHEPPEEPMVLDSLQSSDNFQENSHVHSSFTTSNNISQMENAFTDSQQLEANFTEHLQNIDPIYIVRQYEEAS